MGFQGTPFPSSSPFPFHHSVFLFQLLLRDYCLFLLLKQMPGHATSNSRASAGSALHVLLSVPKPQPQTRCEAKDTACRSSQTRDKPFAMWSIFTCPTGIKSNTPPLSSNRVIGILNEDTGIISVQKLKIAM